MSYNFNNTNANTNTNTNVNNIKEEKNMKANEIINGIVNIKTAEHKNKVEIINGMSNHNSFFAINGITCGVLGGTQRDKEANQRQIQFIIDQCETDNVMEMVRQVNLLTITMANLEGVNLNDTVVINGVEYILDGTTVYAEDGKKILGIYEMYPELRNVELTDASKRAILIGELNKVRKAPVAIHNAHKDDEDGNGININHEEKLSIIDTIKGLRALGMTASWFNIDGSRQPMPICYNGSSDLNEFTKIVTDCINNDKNYLDVILTSCRMDENGISANEVVTIDNHDYIIDYEKKEIWDDGCNVKQASLDDIDYELPQEAVKVMLIERAKDFIARCDYQAQIAAEDDDWDDEYDDLDDNEDDNDEEDNGAIFLSIHML